MTQKITLSIPDMLHEKLKEWRDSFNLSKMFQEALTDAIAKKEAFQKRFTDDFDMPEIIKRLQQEKRIWVRQFHKSGKKEGIKWGQSAHFEDLLYVLKHENTYQLENDDRFKDYFARLFETYEMDEFSLDGDKDHKKMFMDGWTSGVNEFWNQVKESL